MNSWRPAVALLIVGAIGFNILGYCFFSMLIITHKKSMFSDILNGGYRGEELVEFVEMELTNARWEHGREFELDNNMYDVVKSEKKNGLWYFTCKKDSKEDHLKKQKRKAAEKSASKRMAQMNGIFVQVVSIFSLSIHQPSNLMETYTTGSDRYLCFQSNPELPPRI